MPIKKKNRAPSMADIAKVAGVHKMTVSRVLNDYPHVSEEVREKVLSAATKLGYQKNNLISNVMTQVARSRSVDYGTPIIYLSDEPSAEFESLNFSTQAIIRRGKERAALYGFSFESMRYRDGEFSHERINQILKARGVQGLIINVGYEDPVELKLDWERLVAVTSGGRLKYPRNLPQVHSDIPRYMRHCCRELDNRGYERVGFLVSTKALEVFSGFSLSSPLLYQHELPENQRVPLLITEGYAEQDEFMEWFEAHKPDAVVSYMGEVYDWLAEAGYRVAEDVGLVFTNIQNLQSRESRFSGIYQDRGLLGEAAVDHVVQGLLAGDYGLPKHAGRFLIPFEWNEGQTLRPRLK